MLSAKLDGLIVFARGERLYKLIPHFPPPMTETIVKGGGVQKEAAEALKKIRKGITSKPFITAGLSAKLDHLIELGRGHADLSPGSGRAHNPLYDPTAVDRVRRPHRIGEGVEKSIPLSRVISPQATIHGKKVRSMKDALIRGTARPRKVLPTVQRSGSKFIVHDGNHALAAALRAGKRMARVLVQ